MWNTNKLLFDNRFNFLYAHTYTYTLQFFFLSFLINPSLFLYVRVRFYMYMCIYVNILLHCRKCLCKRVCVYVCIFLFISWASSCRRDVAASPPEILMKERKKKQQHCTAFCKCSSNLLALKGKSLGVSADQYAKLFCRILLKYIINSFVVFPRRVSVLTDSASLVSIIGKSLWS